VEWVASTLHTTSQHGVSSITTDDAHTSAASSRLNCPPVNLNVLVRFAERPNLVSAHVPSRFKRAIPLIRGKQSGLKWLGVTEVSNVEVESADSWVRVSSYFVEQRVLIYRVVVLCDRYRLSLPALLLCT
jgi:hypothetical protein